MAVHHVTVTLGTGPTPIVAQSGSNPTINCKEVQIQSESGNAAVYIGGSTVSSTDYGQSIAATVVLPVVLRPPGNTTINLASTYLFGTSTQKVHVLYVQ